MTGTIQQRRKRRSGRQHAPGRAARRLTPNSLARALYGKDVSPSATAIARIQQPLRETAASRRPGFCGHSMDERLVEMIELPGHPWFSAASSTRNSSTRAPVTRCSLVIEAALRQCQHRRRRTAGMKLAWFRRRPGPAAVPDRRPLRDRVRTTGPGHRRTTEGNHRAAGHSVHLQILVRQSQPSSRTRALAAPVG